MQSKKILAILIALTSSCGWVLGADWREFRGPSGNGFVADEIPIEWSLAANERWRSELPGEGWSSPIVIGQTIFLTAAIPASSLDSPSRDALSLDSPSRVESLDDSPSRDPSIASTDLKLCLLAIDSTNGQLIQQVHVFTEHATTASAIHSKNSHASPTPFFDGTHLFVHFGHQGTACVALDGTIVWRNDSLGYPPVHGNGGSPVVAGDHLIFARDGADISEVTALDKHTGRIAWQTERNVDPPKQFSFCTPLLLELAGQTQLILPGSNVVQSLDPSDGREIWRVRYEGYSVIPKPIYHAGLVFISTSYDRARLLAIDPTGKGDVTQTHVRWTTQSAAVPHTPSLVARDGQVMMISDSGIAAAYDASTGDELWKKRIGGNFSASPLLCGSQLHLLSEEGDWTVLDVAGQEPRELATNRLGERVLASPAVIDDELIIRTAQALYRIGR